MSGLIRFYGWGLGKFFLGRRNNHRPYCAGPQAKNL